jgi:hypothetical protein
VFAFVDEVIDLIDVESKPTDISRGGGHKCFKFGMSKVSLLTR